MKLTAKTIPEFMSQPARNSRAVLLYGPDAGLVQERANTILKTILGGEFATGKVELTPEQLKDDPARLADEISSMSLLGDKRAILVRGAGERLAKVIESVFTDSSDGNYLVVCAEELTPRSNLRALFEGHDKLAALPCYKDEAQDVQNLVRRTFDSAGIRMRPDVLAYIAGSLGNDRMVTRSELDKILLYLGDQKELSMEEAEALVGHNRDIGLDSIALLIGDGNIVKLEEELQQAFREKVQPIALLRAAQRHFQRLYTLNSEMLGGKAAEACVASVRPPLFFRNVPIFTRQLKAWGSDALVTALDILRRAELECKGGAIPQTLAVQRAFTAIAGQRQKSKAVVV